MRIVKIHSVLVKNALYINPHTHTNIYIYIVIYLYFENRIDEEKELFSYSSLNA